MNYQPLINTDYKSRLGRPGSRLGRIQPIHWLLVSLAASFVAIVVLIMPFQAEATRQAQTINKSTPAGDQGIGAEITRQLALPERDTAIPPEGIKAQSIQPEPDPEEDWQTVTVKSGDSLAVIFSRVGLSARQLHEVLALGGSTHTLKKIHPGETLSIRSNPEDGLLALVYQIDPLNSLTVRRNGDGFEAITTHRTPDKRIQHASGVITSSLFLAARKEGIPDSLTMELANIFGWDIDFALDIREGDRFTLLYEESWLDGKRLNKGTILAAEFVSQGKAHQAIRYTDDSGKTDYYALDGSSMRKAFLRSPVAFTRISSGFSLGRKHPVLNKIRAHKGVDYAASRGTPVKATSDGKITFRGKKGGYGKTVVIQHGSKYSTLYAHLSGYAKGQRIGGRIKQGQVIGYVGSTGLATGPHLHYELRVNGTHRNPLTVKLPGSPPLDKAYYQDFRETADNLFARLETLRETQVAANRN
mgnify:FL=1